MTEIDGNDPGIFYCRSKGRLYAPRGYNAHDIFGFCKAKRVKECGHGSNIVLLTCQPLAIQCLCYIARNAQLIDSLIGLPELIGKKIFDYCVTSGCFDNPTRAKKLISVFDEAYPDNLLVSLSCCWQEDTIQPNLKYFLAFQSLVKIDLSNNYLGDDNAFLSSIWSLPRLEELKLSDNDISDAGIRNYTLSSRMFQRNSSNLQVLNLSYNRDLSSDCLQYLKTFKRLSFLVLVHTGVDIDLKLYTFGQELGLQICQKAEHIDKMCPIFNEGWAACLSSLWMKKECKQEVPNWSQEVLNKFYSRTIQCSPPKRKVKRPRICMTMPGHHALHLCREGNLSCGQLLKNNAAYHKITSSTKKDAKQAIDTMELEADILTIYRSKVAEPKDDISLSAMKGRW